MVVERPADRQFEQVRLFPVLVCVPELHMVAAPGPVWNVVGTHKARVVEESVLHQEVDAAGAEIPRRGAIAHGLAAGKAGDGFVCPHKIGLLVLATLIGRRNVRPAVVADLMTSGHRFLAYLRMALDG